MDPRHQRDRREATSAWRETTSGTNGSGIVRSGVASAGRRDEAADVDGERDRARGDGAGEAGDERRPAGQERRRAGRRPRAGRRTRRRRAAAAPPARRTPSRRRTRAAPPTSQAQRNSQAIGHRRGDERRREEDAAADDVGDDDGRGVERAEPAIERAPAGSACAVDARTRGASSRDAAAASMGNSPIVRPLRRRRTSRTSSTLASTNCEFCSISGARSRCRCSRAGELTRQRRRTSSRRARALPSRVTVTKPLPHSVGSLTRRKHGVHLQRRRASGRRRS